MKVFAKLKRKIYGLFKPNKYIESLTIERQYGYYAVYVNNKCKLPNTPKIIVIERQDDTEDQPETFVIHTLPTSAMDGKKFITATNALMYVEANCNKTWDPVHQFPGLVCYWYDCTDPRYICRRNLDNVINSNSGIDFHRLIEVDTRKVDYELDITIHNITLTVTGFQRWKDDNAIALHHFIKTGFISREEAIKVMEYMHKDNRDKN